MSVTVALAVLGGIQAVGGMMSANAQTKALQQQQAEIARSAQENARRQADALAKEGSLVAGNKAVEIARREATARSSYLASGLGMSGTPEAVSENIFDTGLKDIKQIGENYSNSAYNTSADIVGKARQQIGSLQSQVLQAQASGRNALISGMSTAFGSGVFSGAGAGAAVAAPPTQAFGSVSPFQQTAGGKFGNNMLLA